MFSKSIVPVALALFASSALSTPIVVPFSGQSFGYDVKWQVAGFRFECDTQAAQTCSYSFDVDSIDPADDEKHVRASCVVFNAPFNHQEFVDCPRIKSGNKIALVKASLPFRPLAMDDMTTLRIRVMFSDPAPKTYFYEANQTANYNYWLSLSNDAFPMNPLSPYYILDDDL